LPSFEDEKVYFLVLSTNDSPKTNVYWLTPKMDVLDWDATNFYQTNCTSWANMTALQDMPRAEITASGYKLVGTKGFVDIQNNGSALGLNIKLRLTTKQDPSKSILPIVWSENYFTLLPGKSIEVSFKFTPDPSTEYAVKISCFNCQKGEV
jgi:exo-1,4-beta-D-glucosaminidase